MTGNLINLGATQLRFVWNNYLQWRREHGITEEPSEGDDQPASGA
jgi:hypothetical protein